MTTKFTLQESEKKEIQKRGFFVLKNTTFFRFLKSGISIFLLSGLITGMLSLILLFADNVWRESSLDIYSNYMWKSPYIWILFWLLASIYLVYNYSISSKLFFSEKWILAYGIISSKVEIEKKDENLSLLSSIIWNIKDALKYVYDLVGMISFSRNNPASMLLAIIGTWWILGLYQVWLILWNFLGINESYLQLLWWDFVLRIVFAFSPLVIILFTGLLGNYIIHKINPLYAFWNLWSHIQSLTPTIKEKSREIEANFQEDMDFGKLRSGFSDLSASLAKVSEYILKLEIAEKKANKWNLFDSVKYINSLKWDIVKPLIALRSFLSTRLSELEESKGEMRELRVKVGWWEETLALQSARTEPLMVELRENIEKLDTMIEKL